MVVSLQILIVATYNSHAPGDRHFIQLMHNLWHAELLELFPLHCLELTQLFATVLFRLEYYTPLYFTIVYGPYLGLDMGNAPNWGNSWKHDIHSCNFGRILSQISLHYWNRVEWEQRVLEMVDKILLVLWQGLSWLISLTWNVSIHVIFCANAENEHIKQTLCRISPPSWRFTVEMYIMLAMRMFRGIPCGNVLGCNVVALCFLFVDGPDVCSTVLCSLDQPATLLLKCKDAILPTILPQTMVVECFLM